MNQSERKKFYQQLILFFFSFFFPVYEPLQKSWFDVPTMQMYIFIFFVSAGVLLSILFSHENP